LVKKLLLAGILLFAATPCFVHSEVSVSSGVQIIIIESDSIGGKNASALPAFDYEQKINFIKQFVPGLEVKKLSSKKGDGKKILKKLKTDYLPVFLFDKKDAADPLVKNFIDWKWVSEKEGYLIFSPKITGVHVFTGRKTEPRTLDVFIMSHCPFGVEAVKKLLLAAKENRLPKDLNLRIRYIIDEEKTEITLIPVGDEKKGAGYELTGSIEFGGVTSSVAGKIIENTSVKYTSSHGSGELEEDIRQLLILKYYPSLFGDYFLQKSQDIKSSLWDDAAEKVGIDYNFIRKKYKEEKDAILKEEAEYTTALKVGSSPTVIWENRYAVYKSDDLEKILGVTGLKWDGSCRGK